MPSLVRTEEGRSGGSSSVEKLHAACPWWTRSGARACGTEAREEESRASREARAARLSLQKGVGDATGQPRVKRHAANGECALCMAAMPWTRAAH